MKNKTENDDVERTTKFKAAKVEKDEVTASYQGSQMGRARARRGTSRTSRTSQAAHAVDANLHAGTMSGRMRSMKRPPFQHRTFSLVGTDQRASLMALVENLPIDAEKPVKSSSAREKQTRPECSLLGRSAARIRRAGMVRGRQYSAEVWHEYPKRRFLPAPTMLISTTRTSGTGSAKWSSMPNGRRG